MTSFTYQFEELPLAVVDGIEAAFINGSVEVQYDEDGGWKIDAVNVEGFGERVNGKREWPHVPAPARLADLILHRFAHADWADKIETAVCEQVAKDYEYAADSRADLRRNMMMERF